MWCRATSFSLIDLVLVFKLYKKVEHTLNFTSVGKHGSTRAFTRLLCPSKTTTPPKQMGTGSDIVKVTFNAGPLLPKINAALFLTDIRFPYVLIMIVI